MTLINSHLHCRLVLCSVCLWCGQFCTLCCPAAEEESMRTWRLYCSPEDIVDTILQQAVQSNNKSLSDSLSFLLRICRSGGFASHKRVARQGLYNMRNCLHCKSEMYGCWQAAMLPANCLYSTSFKQVFRQKAYKCHVAPCMMPRLDKHSGMELLCILLVYHTDDNSCLILIFLIPHFAVDEASPVCQPSTFSF